MKFLWAIVGVLCLATCAAGEDKKPSLGMWSWKPSHFETATARNEMLEFCQKEGVSHVDQHVSIKDGAIENADALKQLIVRAAKQNISVNVLRGDKEMFLADNHQRTLTDVKTVVAFNSTLPEDAKLLGIKFDVEPYLTSQWKAGGEPREKLMLDYLEFLVLAKGYLKEHASEFELAVDIPFWWDESGYEVTFQGDRKLFTYHILDRVNWGCVMSYRRDPNAIAELVSKEVDYAAKSDRNRMIAPAMETGNHLREESHISFAGVPPEQFRSALASLRSKYADNPQVRCVMLHHYGSLRPYLEKTEE